jgi:hypothetical protein
LKSLLEELALLCRTVIQMARTACIWANEKSTVKARQCCLVSTLKGHGVWVSGEGATATLTKCVIEKHGGCGVLCEGSSLALVIARECETRSNQECGYKASAGA